MSDSSHIYIAIDLKSFYASVECVERECDPLTTNLVVADESRTEKTICLAVSPSLKAYGIPGRARLFEVVQKVKQINKERRSRIAGGVFTGKSANAEELKKDPTLELTYIAAPPRMALYMEKSNQIYDIYLKYVAPEDMHVYSVDEVFMDVIHYLKTYQMSARELAEKMIRDVLKETGVTATAGIGTNLYLCKVAMDIVAKHVTPDANGVRIAELDEMSYRRLLWDHRPLTDFWRVGGGYRKKLEAAGLYTMGDIARCSLGGEQDFYNEDFLYKMFGINAELLIDHAWGYEPTTIDLIKAYKPETNSISSGQVLQCPYEFEKGKLIVREMTDLLVLDLVRKKLAADQIVLSVGYDHTGIPENYQGELNLDRYGKRIPKAAHGSVNLGKHTASTRLILEKVTALYDRIVDAELLVRRMNVTANHLIPEHEVQEEVVQYSLFDDVQAQEQRQKQEKIFLEKEHQLQKTMLRIKERYGKNAILKGMNFREGATTIERNSQVGGHRA